MSGISHIQDACRVGHGLAAKADAVAVAGYAKQAAAQKSVDFVLNIIPDSVVGALARGDILQVLRLGCSKPVVGLVMPTGYSFNLDGTNIYMTLATLFIGEALDRDRDRDQLTRALDDRVGPSNVPAAVRTG